MKNGLKVSSGNGGKKSPSVQSVAADDNPVDPGFDIDISQLPLPPNGGWGWVVVFASLVCNLIIDGVCYTFGIFLIEFVDFFGESKSKTALVGSLVPGMYQLIGPIASALANKFGFRIVTIVGGLLAATSFFISTFSTNINVLLITYGVMGGMGFGLMYLPAVVIVSFYFDTKRALATGIAVCGSGIGTFLFSPLAKFLLSNYGWKGSYWIISAIILNTVACGLLFKPPVLKARNPKSVEMLDIHKYPPNNIIMKMIEDNKIRTRTTSTGSWDGVVITSDNRIIKDPEILKTIEEVHEHQEEGEGEGEKVGTTIEDQDEEKNAASGDEVSTSVVKVEPMDDEASHAKPKSVVVDVYDNTPTASQRLLYSKPQLFTNRQMSQLSQYSLAKRGSSVAVISSDVLAPALSKISLHEAVREIVALPLSRQDIFYPGSVTSIPQYQASTDMASYVASTITIPPAVLAEAGTAKSKLQPIVSALQAMFDFSLFKSPTFDITCLSSVLAMLALYIPFVFLTDYAVSNGVDMSVATLLLSILGIFNTFGRIFTGWSSDQRWANCIVMHNMSLIIAGVATCLLPALVTFSSLVGYSIVFGIGVAAWVTLRSIVLVELLGLAKLTNAFGISLLCQGFAAMLGSPIAGALYDATLSYTVPFLFAGVLLICAGLVMVPVRRIASWEDKRTKRLEEGDGK